MTKVCSRCKQELSLDQFYKDEFHTPKREWGISVGLSSRCKKCCWERRKEYAYKYYATPKWNRYKHLKTKYKMTPKDYEDMYNKKKGRCFICQLRFDQLVVDHDHATKAIRGLLCRKCNTLLGMASDDVSILKRAQKYLNQAKKGD